MLRMFYKYAQGLTFLGFLLMIVSYFYFSAIDRHIEVTLLSILFLSLITDGLYLFLHLPRKTVDHKNVTFDPDKLTVIIACFNGENVIGKTIENALTKVPPNQIIVVSDASTDNTVQVAKAYGVRVHENKRNVNKAFSISGVMHKVETSYVLILDDDTLIGKTFIPTSLLDDGYSAVALNVVPIITGSLINRYQIFEYRKSMHFGKALRGSVGAVGNVSGAIGLYRTEDLVSQTKKHSGQFGGEDQQRTSLVHLETEGKGVTYYDSPVETLAPDTFKQWAKQRSKRWNLSCSELCIVYLRVLISPKTHYLLKFEKLYQLYLFFTDPLRLLLVWLFVNNPLKVATTYIYYIALNLISWFKLGRKDSLFIVLTFPLYSMVERLCRYYAYGYWLIIKYRYLFKEKYHHLAEERMLVLEYAGVFVLMIISWSIALVLLLRIIISV